MTQSSALQPDLTHGPELEMFVSQGASKLWDMPAVSPTERSESVSGTSAGKLGRVNGCWCLRPLSLQRAGPARGNWGSSAGPEVFLPQVLLRDPLKSESQPRRRKQVPSRERELSKQSPLQPGTISVQRAEQSQISGKSCGELDWKSGGDHHAAPRLMTEEPGLLTRDGAESGESDIRAQTRGQRGGTLGSHCSS